MDVVCFGTALMDITVGLVDQVDLLRQENMKVSTIEYTPGGDACNESKVLANLGHDVAYVGRVGDDALGNAIIDDLNANGVNVSHIKKTDDSTCSVIKLIGKNDRKTFIIPEYDTTLQTLSTEDFDLGLLMDTKILTIGSLLVHPYLTAEKLVPILDEAKRNHVLTFADIGSTSRPEAFKEFEEVWKRLDYFFPNYEEGKALTGKDDYEEIADVLLGAGIKNVVVKLGKSGSFFKNGEEAIMQPVFSVENVLDTTGAGDTFIAGFISGMLQGFDVKKCLEFGSAASALTIQVHGASTAVKSCSQIKEFIKRRNASKN